MSLTLNIPNPCGEGCHLFIGSFEWDDPEVVIEWKVYQGSNLYGYDHSIPPCD
jgi:hypothetical protein